MFEVDKKSMFVEYTQKILNTNPIRMTLILTSPPYFNVERYSYDDTQSWVRYKTIDEWNKNFLQKTLKKIWNSIKSGGYLLVNISDVYTGSGGSKKWLEICNPMNDFLSTFSDSEYQGCIGMEMISNDLIVVVKMKTPEDRFKDETKELQNRRKIKLFVNQYGYGKNSNKK